MATPNHAVPLRQPSLETPLHDDHYRQPTATDDNVVLRADRPELLWFVVARLLVLLQLSTNKSQSFCIDALRIGPAFSISSAPPSPLSPSFLWLHLSLSVCWVGLLFRWYDLVRKPASSSWLGLAEQKVYTGEIKCLCNLCTRFLLQAFIITETMQVG